jgi:hypothetical protein
MQKVEGSSPFIRFLSALALVGDATTDVTQKPKPSCVPTAAIASSSIAAIDPAATRL